MIDLHTHSLLSDGSLLPSELAQRAYVKGIKVLAITDHVDHSTIDHVVPRIVRACEELNKYWAIKVIPGVELTHLAPEAIRDLAKKTRALGAKLVLVHGETIAEPVPLGTNMAALKAEIDILAHPGLITPEEVDLAKARSISLEITARKGHSLTNGHVAQMAIKAGASLVFNTDSHDPEDLLEIEGAKKILLGAGLNPGQIERVFQDAYRLAEKIL